MLGTLREWGAVDLVLNRVPPRDPDVGVTALRTAADYYLARGVTWVQDAWVNPDDIDVYLEAARRDALGMRFNLAFYADPRYFDTQVATFAESRRRVTDAGSPLLTANTVKFFADGVVENETGALLAPYCSGLHEHPRGQERSDWGINTACRCGKATRWPTRPGGSTNWASRSTSTPSATPQPARRSTRSSTRSRATARAIVAR